MKGKIKMKIRELKRSDYEDVYELIKNSLGYENDREKLFARLDKMNGGIYHTYVAEIDGRAVGFIGFCVMSAYEFEGDYIRVLALAADENYRGMGVGTALLKAAEDFAAENGMELFALNSGMSRTDAHKFYENRGFFKYGYSFKKKLEK